MRNLAFILIGMFAVGSSSFMMAGLLPEIGKTLGQPISVTGQGITAFTLTYLFSAPIFSMIFSNKSAGRTFQIALLIFLLGNVLTLLSENIYVFIASRIITGLGAGIFNPLCASIAVQMGDPAKKGKTLSWVWGANSAGVVLSVPFGVYIASEFNWQYSILYILLLGFITLVGFSLQQKDISLPNTTTFSERVQLLVDKKVLSIIGVSCFTVLASTGLYSYISTISSESPHKLATILLVWGIGGFIGSFSVGHIIDRTGNPQGVLTFILLGLCLTLMSIPSLVGFNYISLVPFFLWGLLGWATLTPQQHVLFDLYEKQRTLVSALNSSAISLGSSIGTALGGVIIASGFDGRNLPFWSALILVGVIIFQVLLSNYMKRNGVLNEKSYSHS